MLFQVTEFVVLSYSSLWKLVQMVQMCCAWMQIGLVIPCELRTEGDDTTGPQKIAGGPETLKIRGYLTPSFPNPLTHTDIRLCTSFPESGPCPLGKE